MTDLRLNVVGGRLSGAGPRRTGLVRALLAVIAALGLMVWLPSAAQAAGGERILSFTADYNLAKDGSVAVTETLVWQFGSGEHHGIKRNVTVEQGVEKPPDKFRVYEMSDVSVSSPTGANADLYVSEVGADKVIRIGSPDVPFSGEAQQTYVIKYHLAHVANGFPDHAELYWNVTGSHFDFPVDAVKVSVHGPAAITKALCFQGADRSAAPCQATPGSTATYSADGLGAGQQVTIVASLPVSAVTGVAPDLRDGETGFSGDNAGSTIAPDAAKALGLLGFGGGLAIPALAAALMGTLYWRRGRDEQYAGLTPGLTPVEGAPAPVTKGQKGPVAVQFTPPAGVQPGLVGTIIDEEANTIDVSATIVDLAVRGYLTIEEVGAGGMFKRTDWKLTKMVPPEHTAPLLPYEETLIEGIFSESNPVLLSNLKNKFSATLSAAKGQMYSEVTRRGWFRKSPEKARGSWILFGSVLIGAGLLAGGFLGFNSSDTDRIGGLSFPIPSGFVLAAGLLIAGLIIRILGKRMAAKTAAGSAVLAQSLGFKQYLVTAEARQIRFEEAQDIFSRYLPYAIVFGVADRWAGVFSEVAEAATAAGQSIGTPGWYVFAGAGGYGDFGGIASGVGSFSDMAAGTLTSTPGSSGNSGFSSGGGFSGGGGGGGGGSSW